MNLPSSPLQSTPPLISVIIPAYNEGAYVGQALSSVLSQTYGHLEVIVVDDGSQDDTADVVRAVVGRDERVRLLTQSNLGVAAARNAAIRASRGEYIAPLDADDIWYPEKLKKQLQLFEASDSDVGLVYTWWEALDEDESFLWASSEWDLEGFILEPLVVTNFIGNASVPLIRRACIERVGGYNAHLRSQGGQGCEDWDLSLRVAEHYLIRVVPEYLMGYRRRKDSMSSDHKSMARSYELVADAVRRRHPEIPPSIFRWSRQHFFHWLATRSRKMGDYSAALRWLVRAVAADPAAILSVGTAQPGAVRKSFPHSWKSWKPYDRICLRRWRLMTERPDIRSNRKKRPYPAAPAKRMAGEL